ncbi:tyrosine-type recombinase/integrase [Bacillus niameyensis]|uniref:tyrosine-type recombinase/integrase n=1 Tax=Bacillus niameyensis TaxID=1522308 RepID=UPI000783DBA2|nr:tyrosine-type recombinase/integrase [Bacillus niameyensis]
MEYVVPVKDIEKINAIKRILKKASLRDYVLFVLGINTGIKIQDLLVLKVENVWDGNQGKEFLIVPDRKSGEQNTFYLNNRIQIALERYLKNSELKQSDYLFKSKRNEKPVTRQQAYRIINSAAKEAGVEGKIGMHTLRKTFGYHAYRKGVAISILMAIFHHKSRSETLKYIDVTKAEKRVIKVDVNL